MGLRASIGASTPIDQETVVQQVQTSDPQYVSPARASAMVGVSPRTLRRAIRAGRLRAHRVGRLVRIAVPELRRWVEADAAGPVSASPAARTTR